MNQLKIHNFSVNKYVEEIYIITEELTDSSAMELSKSINWNAIIKVFMTLVVRYKTVKLDNVRIMSTCVREQCQHLSIKYIAL